MSEYDALYKQYIAKAKKYVCKRLNKTSRVHMPIGTNNAPKAVRSKVVLVAIDSTGKKIYMHAHNL